MKNSLQKLLVLGVFLVSGLLLNAQTVKTGLFFDKSGDYVVIPSNAAYDFGNGPFSVEMWIQADTGQSTYPYLLYRKDTIVNATGWGLRLSSGGKLNLEMAGNPYGPGFGGGVPNLTDGQCHHIVYVRETNGTSDTLRAYIDGNLIKKHTKDAPDVDVSHNSDIYIGWIRGGFNKQDYTYNGMIKELRLWNIARTATDINPQMDKFLQGNETGLVGNWRFYENSGSIVKDYSSTGNDGTLGSGGTVPTWQDFCDVIDDVLPTGIQEHNAGTVSSYPNPATDQLTFRMNSDQQMNRLRIYNAVGQMVHEDVNPTTTLNVSGFNSGIYFYEIRMTNNEIVSNRFVKE